ncbi:MAG: hypothetical protein HY940_07845 [Gammaproteobacteria bacterium]|nr:hypothetical protein [Gammaproteobacteria bacterium]
MPCAIPRVISEYHDWEVVGESIKGTLFLLFLVTIALMMPVEQLPIASWQSAFSLGFVSAVFDNIPPTALAIRQDGWTGESSPSPSVMAARCCGSDHPPAWR